MKKILFIFLISLMFFSCNQKYYEENVFYYETSSWSEDFEKQSIFIINSKIKLEEYVNNDLNDDLNTLEKKYNEDYFKDKSIVIIYIVESSGSNSLKLKSFNINNGILDVVVKRFTPGPNEVGTCDIKYHHIVVEISMDEALSIDDYKLEIKE